MNLSISQSVGAGGVNNAGDVAKIQQRLVDLGYSFVGPVDGTARPGLVRAIKLFQAIKNGLSSLQGDGRVDVNGDTIHWLQAVNAPRWQRMPAGGEGFHNFELQDTSDHHDFGTNWLADTLLSASKLYATSYLNSHTASLVTLNDVSLPTGGDTPMHAGHETGLMADLRLPKKNSGGPITTGRTVSSPDYDRAAMRAFLIAFRAQPMADPGRIFLNDHTLIGEGLCRELPGHDNHVHVSVRPPARQLQAAGEEVFSSTRWEEGSPGRRHAG